MLLRIIGNVTKNTIEFEVEDKKTSSIFYQFDIAIPEGCVDGEYTYELVNDDKIIATGLLQIGDYDNENKKYDNNKTDTIVYNG